MGQESVKPASAPSAAIDTESYCRELEAYLCRKNDGHLIRITGPAFDRVTSWARQGIPLTVAFTGVDRYFERYYRRGPRRRPVQIQFCEADVLDAFDAWRRAVGVLLPMQANDAHAAADAESGEESGAGRRKPSLAAHVERVIARLTTLRASSKLAARHGDALETAARELDGLLADCRRLRGDARDALLERIRGIDTALMADVSSGLDPGVRDSADAEARQSLAPFRDRMAPEAYRASLASAVDRQVRERLGLPVIVFD